MIKIKLRKRVGYTGLLFFLLFLGIIIDNIAGYQMRITGGESVLTKGYRLVIFIFLLLIIVMYDRKNMSYFVLLGYGILLPVIQALENHTLAGIAVDELYILKLIFPITLIRAGETLAKKRMLTIYHIDRYLKLISWIYPLSILIPYMAGSGFEAYTNSGYSGFYGAGNEISILLSIMFIVHINDMYYKFRLKSLIGTFCAAIAIVLTGTKTGIIIICMAVGYFGLIKRKGVSKKLLYICISVIMIFALAFVIYKLLYNEIDTNIGRLLFKYNQLDRNIINFIFSNRNIKILPNLKHNISNPVSLLFGKGYYAQVLMTGQNLQLASIGLIEMDFFDIFFQYGIVMAVLVWSIYISYILKNEGCVRKEYTFAGFCMLIYSFMAGHTVYSANTGTLLGILCLGAALADKRNLFWEKIRNEKSIVINEYVSI